MCEKPARGCWGDVPVRSANCLVEFLCRVGEGWVTFDDAVEVGLVVFEADGEYSLGVGYL